MLGNLLGHPLANDVFFEDTRLQIPRRKRQFGLKVRLLMTKVPSNIKRMLGIVLINQPSRRSPMLCMEGLRSDSSSKVNSQKLLSRHLKS